MARVDWTYNPDAYTKLDDPISCWEAIARRQRAKDEILIPRLARYFRPGRVLELGAGAGQLSVMMRKLGYDVVASDYHEFFVAHQRSLGLTAYRVDATDILGAGIGQFANIFAHSITPLVSHDEDVLVRSYRSASAALTQGGVFVSVAAMEQWRNVARVMAWHREIASRAGFAHVEVFRNQLLPSLAYRQPLTPIAALAETMLGRALGSRFVVVATNP